MQSAARMVRAAVLGCAVTAGGTGAVQPAAGPWPVYANARFGYHICYPAALLRPAAEAPNGDGRQFNGPGGAVLRVWGSNNATGDTVASSARADRERLGRGGRVTYAVTRADWYVLSGWRGGEVFYHKSLLANGAFHTMELRYPATAQRRWAPVAARLSRCFGAG